MKEYILIVEDDNDINHMLQELLDQHEYETIQAYSGTEAMLCMERWQPEAVILDLMLPGMPGEEVLWEIKKKYPQTGVIVASAKDEVHTRVSLLRMGADDYVVKPFDTEELLARLEAVLRRSRGLKKAGGAENIPKGWKQQCQLEYKDLCVDRENLQVWVGGREAALTKREYLILELLMSNPGKVFTKSNIYESVWNEEFLGEDNAVNVHISNIRQKLAKLHPEETYIQTVWGIGFKMK
ncbi:MAG: response regulator transcription factor [Lachnospiraceae bacterium]|nr:response regulator transcription factor [Lachnospiraceae bacterium]